MSVRRRYRKRPDQFVTAVQLDLETTGFSYKKWGGDQICKPGDWLVNNDGEVYTIDADSFRATYELVNPGMYIKKAPIWAEMAAEAGYVETKEGQSQYAEGDYIVSNNEDGSDTYCIAREKFEAMYELDDNPAD